jgi:HAD superfamily hydrolase (TIGR01509 family)
MVKLIIFDLDGVLVKTKQLHYECLNNSLNEIDEKYVITHEEHLSIYDGLKTTEKLEILTKQKGLPVELYSKIWKRKQEHTVNELNNLQRDERLVEIFKELKKRKYKLICCSNSIRNTLYVVLSKLGLIEYLDLILSNEDVKTGKPHPEIYWKGISMMGVLPEESLIIEDSPYGLLSANRSSAHVLRVDNPESLTLEKIEKKLLDIKDKNLLRWPGNELNILIPMAGAGSRFQKAGYKLPKPLIDVLGEPMIKKVIDSLNIDGNYIFIVQKEHREKYNLDVMLNLIVPNCKIIEVDSLTEGAACTTLLAKEYINNDNPLIIANSDQYIEWDSVNFMYQMIEQDLDGGLLTFTADNPKWSFVKTNNLGYVTEVAEKTPISNQATVGVYYWSKGSNYVNCAESMINKDIRVNNEFYVCPVYTESILNGDKIKTYDVKNMYGLGTPEDLNIFINLKK